MTLDIPTITVLIGGTVTVIGAIVTGAVSIITAMKVSAIEGHVNSAKTAGEGRELTLIAQLEMMKQVVEEKNRTAALLAQAVTRNQENKS